METASDTRTRWRPSPPPSGARPRTASVLLLVQGMGGGRGGGGGGGVGECADPLARRGPPPPGVDPPSVGQPHGPPKGPARLVGAAYVGKRLHEPERAGQE